ncbi:MAG: hypothetical protein U0I40_02170 [Oscillospiraceae bacterium]|nr:hypothetical protein [Oscillospiraceae bacterium]OLA68593.1 MAG: hypothetical protein BHW52_11605 [Ruminococcus sp. 37_24]
MKEILSYWDISLGLIVIGLGIFKWHKYEIYRKKRDDRMLREGKWVFSKDDSFEYSMCMLLIVIGIIFIYNRLRGNLPNIIILIKEFSTY